MDLISWIIWVGLTIWIFAKTYDIPVQMKMKDSPLDILQKCFAAGQIT
jgi:putative membrane protein